MDVKDSFMFLVLLLLSLGMFGSLSLTYCVWNKQTEVTSELQSELHELQKKSEIADIRNEQYSKLQSEVQDLKNTNIKLQSELADVQNELHELQNELKDTNSRVHLGASEPSQDKGQLKRNVRQADDDPDSLSATEILTNALTEIIERKLVSLMNCDKNEYNHTKCTLKPGPKGEPGPEGEKGTKGEIGDMGQRGKPGDKGVKGNVGYPGYKGEKGREGLAGPQGPPGPTGPQGPRGLQGESGERGDMGQKGEPGEKGMTGNRGYTGYKGEKGVVGPQGPPGPTGRQGPRGTQGKDGVKGEQGQVGDTGLPGPHGDRGDKGDMGPPGPKGETGERGDTGQKGEPGDKGAKGNQGDQGYKGEKGERGTAGPQGTKGEKGMKGNQGYKGEKGERGTASPQGSKGEKGEQGVGVPCGGPGWRRVVFLNMTDPSHVCPEGLNLTTYSRRTCGRAHSGNYNCSSATFSVGGSQYSRVCGRALAYRWGLNFAFLGYHHDSQGIDGQYVCGLSLTHGAPGSRQHIWTFASGLFGGNHNSIYRNYRCPCDNGNTYPSPPFVGNDYFCESVTQSSWAKVFYPNATLWDGQVCEGGGTCCRFNNPPWFTKNLTNSTTEDIELRLCLWFSIPRADIALELLELYVQ